MAALSSTIQYLMSIVTETESSDTLVIAATGFGNKLGLPVDDFFRESGLACTSKIVVSDPSRRKILGGLPPEYPYFSDCLDHLRDRIAAISAKKLLVTGTSGGAHTAMLLGHLLEADYVVGFAPYPYVSFEEMKRQKDPALTSMRRVIEAIDRLQGGVRQYFDLRPPLLEWNGKTRYYIHVSRHNKWDYRRAMYLDGVPNLTIVTHPYSNHAIASSLCRDNRLKECFAFPYRRTRSVKDIVIPAVEFTSHVSDTIRTLVAKGLKRS